MKFVRIFSFACLVIAALMLLSVSVHPAMAAEVINKQMDTYASCHAGSVAFSSLPGMEQKTPPSVTIREVRQEPGPADSDQGKKSSPSAAAGIRTSHPLDGLTLTIADPFEGTKNMAATSPVTASSTAAAATGAGPDSQLAAITAGLSREGYELSQESTHRYESTVTSEDFLSLNASQRTWLVNAGFSLTSADTVQSTREVTYYTYSHTKTGQTVYVMAVQMLDSSKTPKGERMFAVSPAFDAAGQTAGGSPVSASPSGSNSCVREWVAVVLISAGLVITIVLAIIGMNGTYGPILMAILGLILGFIKQGGFPDSDNLEWWVEWAGEGRGAFVAFEIVTGLILFLFLLYAIYDLGVCKGWWEPLGKKSFVWSSQERLLLADNGKSISPELHDRVALVLPVNTTLDKDARWEMVSNASMKVHDSNTVRTKNGTLMAWYLETREPGAGDLSLRYVNSQPVPPEIGTAAYTVHVITKPGKWTVSAVNETTKKQESLGAVSVAVDAAGTPHIGYYDKAGRQIMYATQSGRQWQAEKVADSSGTTATSIALDRAGIPAISYGDGSHYGTLYFAKRTGSGWNVTTVDKGSAGDAGEYSSLLYDKNGVPHIAYTDGHTFATLMYATGNFSAGTWDRIKIDTGGTVGDTGYGASLAFDAAGNPRIAYSSGKHFPDLMYAFKDGGSWAVMKVDDGGLPTAATGLNPSLAVDSRGFSHISYYNSTGSSLRYASWNGTAWVKETVDSDNDAGRYSALVIDSSDRPYIGYYDATFGELRYATRDSPVSAWKTHIVDNAGDAGYYVKAALDPVTNHPGFAYYGKENRTLKYAEWTG